MTGCSWDHATSWTTESDIFKKVWLEMVRLPVVSNEECMRWYNSSGSRQFIPTYTFLCAGYEEGVLDACSGDSGGPLVIDRWAGH